MLKEGAMKLFLDRAMMFPTRVNYDNDDYELVESPKQWRDKVFLGVCSWQSFVLIERKKFQAVISNSFQIWFYVKFDKEFVLRLLFS